MNPFNRHYCSALLIALLSISAYSEVFTWIDKDGKKHYGDKIPPEYVNQGQEVKVDTTNTIQSVKVPIKPAAARQSHPAFSQDQEDDPLTGLSGCELEKALYQQSENCYSKCESTYGGVVHNVSKCHCVDRKKPSC